MPGYDDRFNVGYIREQLGDKEVTTVDEDGGLGEESLESLAEDADHLQVEDSDIGTVYRFFTEDGVVEAIDQEVRLGEDYLEPGDYRIVHDESVRIREGASQASGLAGEVHDRQGF